MATGPLLIANRFVPSIGASGSDAHAERKALSAAKHLPTPRPLTLQVELAKVCTAVGNLVQDIVGFSSGCGEL